MRAGNLSIQMLTHKMYVYFNKELLFLALETVRKLIKEIFKYIPILKRVTNQ